MNSLALLVSGLAITASAIGHDKVTPFGESAPDVFLHWKPFLKVEHGCVPFPAVNEAGEVGGGLKTSGASNGLCSTSEGQVYSRGYTFDDRFAMMYAWYMPKDQPVNGVGGHRHEWESIVVWISEESTDAEYLGIAWSGHGGYTTATKDEDSDSDFDGARPLVSYGTNGITNHELYFHKGVKGGEQPLIDWNALTPQARQALRTHDFGDANCPFNDDNFQSNLDKAGL